MCAAEDLAGRCAQVAGADAGIDAAEPSDPKPDAPPPPMMVTIKVRIDGRGSVVIPAVGSCDAGSGQAECPFEVPKGLPLTLQATPKNHWRFDRWREACDGSPTSTCTLVPTKNLSARAVFASETSDDAL